QAARSVRPHRGAAQSAPVGVERVSTAENRRRSMIERPRISGLREGWAGTEYRPHLSFCELLKRLDAVAATKVGDPIPDFLGGQDWGRALSELCREAAKRLREEDRR